MRRSGRGAFGLACLLCLLGAACGDEDNPQALLAPGSGGVIEGRILVVDGPVLRAEVTATSVGTAADRGVRASTWADSTGAYTLAVPFGRYQLGGNFGSAGRFLYRAAGPVISGAADTLTLLPGRERVHADFPLGAVEIVVKTPAALEGESVSLRLRPRNSRSSGGLSRSASPSSGEARFLYPEFCPGTYVVDLATPWREEIRGFRNPAGLEIGTPRGDTVFVEVTRARMQTVVLRLPEPAIFQWKLDGAWRELASILNVDGVHPYPMVYGPDSTSGRVAEPKSTPDGSSRLALFDPASGPIRLAYDWPWSSGRQWVGGTSFSGATAWEIVPGLETVLPTFADAGIVLRVAFPEPLSRIPMSVTVHDVRGRQLTEAATSGGGNIFVASVLGERTVFLRMRPANGGCGESWIPCWYPGVDSMAQAVPVPLRPGEVIRLETAVVRGGIIEGEFRTVAAQNLLTRIYLVSAADTIRTVCITDLGPDDPSFQFRGVADGPYLLVGGYLDQSRWHRRWYPGSAWASAADTVWVRDHAVVSGVTWTAP